MSAYLSFHTILSYNLQMHYFRDNYVFFLKNILEYIISIYICDYNWVFMLSNKRNTFFNTHLFF